METLEFPKDRLAKGVSCRGTPIRPDLELVHLKVPALRDGTYAARPACFNGAFHLVWTKDRKQVTCPICQKK